MAKIDGEGLHRDLPTIATQIRELVGEDDSLPPVETWQPERVGEIDIRIDSQGEWYYQGDKMERQAVVRLLSRILRRDGEDFFLVTPYEKMKITVDDAPFVVVMVDREGEGEAQKLHFSTQLGDYFTLSADHPLEVSYNERQEPSPYVKVRHGLMAKLSRPVYYELAD
ncbi:hypothetical protein A3741_14620, partial [Oleiphilus sp. HI0069]